MYKPCALFSVLVLAGCAASQPEPADVAAGGEPPGAGIASSQSVVAPLQTHDVSEFDEKTVCEKVTRPGSRIVVEERCYRHDPSDPSPLLQKELVRQQVEALRREQEELQRRERERDRNRVQEAIQRGMQGGRQ